MTRDQRIRREIELVEARYGPVETEDQLQWFVVGIRLSKGWNQDTTWVLVLLPPGYPTTPPDNFYTESELKLADGRQPSNTTGIQQQGDRTCLGFSYHVEPGDWNPHAVVEEGHNLLTYLDGITKRLAEAD